SPWSFAGHCGNTSAKTEQDIRFPGSGNQLPDPFGNDRTIHSGGIFAKGCCKTWQDFQPRQRSRRCDDASHVPWRSQGRLFCLYRPVSRREIKYPRWPLAQVFVVHAKRESSHLRLIAYMLSAHQPDATSNRDPVLVLARLNAHWALGSYSRW